MLYHKVALPNKVLIMKLIMGKTDDDGLAFYDHFNII